MIGIIPIGGHATRMNGLPKFLLPVGDSFLLARLVEQMNDANAEPIVVGVRRDNLALVSSNMLNSYAGESIIYEVNTETMCQTILHAKQHIDMDQRVLLGMPDTYWTNRRVFDVLRIGLEQSLACAALWEVPPEFRHKRGMCDVQQDGFIRRIVDKPSSTDLTFGWGAIAWRPDFWRYINPYDKHVGFSMQRAIADGQPILALPFGGQYFDCGTPDEYYECIQSVEKLNVPA